MGRSMLLGFILAAGILGGASPMPGPTPRVSGLIVQPGHWTF